MATDTIFKIIQAIRRSRDDLATGALTNPKTDGDIAFEYGRVCGLAQGLEAALRLIEDQLKQEEEDHGHRRRDR